MSSLVFWGSFFGQISFASEKVWWKVPPTLLRICVLVPSNLFYIYICFWFFSRILGWFRGADIFRWLYFSPTQVFFTFVSPSGLLFKSPLFPRGSVDCSPITSLYDYRYVSEFLQFFLPSSNSWWLFSHSNGFVGNSCFGVSWAKSLPSPKRFLQWLSDFFLKFVSYFFGGLVEYSVSGLARVLWKLPVTFLCICFAVPCGR